MYITLSKVLILSYFVGFPVDLVAKIETKTDKGPH